MYDPFFRRAGGVGRQGWPGQQLGKAHRQVALLYVNTSLLTHGSGSTSSNNTGGLFKKCASETFETVKPRNVETPVQRTLVDVTSGKEYVEPIAEDGFRSGGFSVPVFRSFTRFKTGFFRRAHA
jgi:hypothetical protein